MYVNQAFKVFVRIATFLGVFLPASAQFFAPATSPYPGLIGHQPVAIAAADFNGDSIPDLAVVSQLDQSVAILLGNGAGGYTNHGSFQTGSLPSSLTAADFNRDGILDLAVANQGDDTVLVFAGNGSGGFAPISAIPALKTEKSPVFIATADLNNDALPDLVSINRASGSVSVFLSVATGGPAVAVYRVGSTPTSVAVADFNGDGRPDLAVTNELDNSVTVLLNNGSGGFFNATGSPFLAGARPTFAIAADFNADGNIDLAVCNQESSNIVVLLGNGTGRFTNSSGGPISTGSQPFAMASGDVNADGIPDIAVANFQSGNVTVLLGNGSGGFKTGPGNPFSAGNGPRALAITDFSGDGLPDLVVVNSADGTLSFLPNMTIAAILMTPGASFSNSAPVAPNSLVTIFGAALASGTFMTPAGSQPGTCLGGVNVSMTDASGVSTPLLLSYVSPAQINALIPATVAIGNASFSVGPSNLCPAPGNNPLPSLPQRGAVTVATAAPSLFSASGTGKGPAAGYFLPDLLSGDRINIKDCATANMCIPNAQGGSVLVLLGTGIRNRARLSDVSVSISGTSIPAFYAGPSATGVAGVDEVHVALPSSLAHTGTVFITVLAGSVTSNPVTIYFP